MPNPTHPPVPVDEGDERKELSHSVARTALLACSRVLRRDFPNCHAVLASYIDEQESIRSERDTELPGWKDRPDAAGYWLRRSSSGVLVDHWFTIQHPEHHAEVNNCRWFGPVIITPDGSKP